MPIASQTCALIREATHLIVKNVLNSPHKQECQKLEDIANQVGAINMEYVKIAKEAEKMMEEEKSPFEKIQNSPSQEYEGMSMVNCQYILRMSVRRAMQGL